MSELYPDLPNTQMPLAEDAFERMSDLTIEDLPIVKEYEEKYAAGDIAGASAVLEANPQLKNKIINANNLNQLGDAIKALERYYLSDIQDYIMNVAQPKGVWDPLKKYSKYNVVQYGINQAYESFMALSTKIPIGTLPTDKNYWIPITLRGEPGASGIGLTWRGKYSNIIQYTENDCVSYDNVLWSAKVDSIGQTPTKSSEFWVDILDSNIPPNTYAPYSHTTNGTIHISADERNKWNNKANVDASGKVSKAVSADTLSTARTISISGGATGTATSFNGGGNITIPVTALDISKANAGTLPIARGGTGATTAASARNALGLGNTTGALPVANGGTGQTTAAGIRNSLGLGNTTGVLPVANGGTGNNTGYVTAGKKAGTTLGSKATAEGIDTTASGESSHAEGNSTIASNLSSHAEGHQTKASAWGSHAEGLSTTASGTSSHAEGFSTTASRNESHAEGLSTTASNNAAHAEGTGTIASGDSSHAEGSGTTASGNWSHAEGYKTTALGRFSHAEGWGTTASGDWSHAAGDSTVANAYQYVIGSYNVKKAATGYSNSGDRLIVGSGYEGHPKNCFRASCEGIYGIGAYNTSGADYAEYFQWADGNPDNEDRYGYFVTLEGDKIRVADSDDEYILGVISSTPSVIGNSYDDQWHGMELLDNWGRPILEEYTEPAEYHEVERDDGTVEKLLVRLEMSGKRPKPNPAYDNTKPYIGRSERPEWSPVGMLGVLRARDDGTCQVNGYCTVAGDGAATAAENGWRVIARVAEDIVKIVFR